MALSKASPHFKVLNTSFFLCINQNCSFLLSGWQIFFRKSFLLCFRLGAVVVFTPQSHEYVKLVPSYMKILCLLMELMLRYYECFTSIVKTACTQFLFYLNFIFSNLLLGLHCWTWLCTCWSSQISSSRWESRTWFWRKGD